MTAAPHSIDPTTYLDDLLAQASPDLMRQMLQGFINQILSAQADTVCGAEYGVASTERVNHRNGYRHRDLDTRVGTIDVAVPKLRHGAFFPDWLLERRTRAERALSTVIATCYLKGVSTRRMNDLVATLGIANMSKSQVSRMSEELDEMVADFKNRPLDPGGYAYLSCDALTIKVREGGRVVKCSVLLATGVNADGYREMLGMHVATTESNASWKGFFQDLKLVGFPMSTWLPVMPTKASSTPFPKCYLMRRGSAAAPILRRTFTRRSRRHSGLWSLQCSRPSFNNQMPNPPGPKPVR